MKRFKCCLFSPLLLACSGDTFMSVIPPIDGEAGDSATETSSSPDGGDAAMADARDEECAPYDAAPFGCGSATITPQATFCISTPNGNAAATTPAPCRTCASNYTCACLKAADYKCPTAMPTNWDCVDTAKYGPQVNCH